MNGDRLLSIVIPVYNAERYLPACLEHILTAELPDFEILLIDDGSTDGSGAVCESYERKNANIRSFRQANAGPSAARNYGLRESRGKYIVFFDADDYIDPASFHRTAVLLPQYEAELWASDFARVAENGCVLDRVWQIGETEEPIADPSYMLRFLSDGERVWNVFRYIFRRDFLLENELFFEEGADCAEDLEFVVRALSCVRTPVFFHNPYYSYRVNYGSTLTQRFNQKRVGDLMDMLQLSEKHLAGQTDGVSVLLRDKLVKEYILNLSLCAELPAAERPAALARFEEAAGLLRQPRSLRLRAVCLFVRVFGIRPSARLLLLLKKVKRRVRRRKIERYEVPA